MNMSLDQMRSDLRARALKKRHLMASGLLAAQFESKAGVTEQIGNLEFQVLEFDAAGAIKSFKVRTENGAEFTFNVTERDGDGAIKSFKVVR